MPDLSTDHFVTFQQAGLDSNGNAKWNPSDILDIDPGDTVEVETAHTDDTYISEITYTAYVENIDEETDEDGTLRKREILTATDYIEGGYFYVILHHADDFPPIDEDVDGYVCSVTHVPEDQDEDVETELLEDIEVVDKV